MLIRITLALLVVTSVSAALLLAPPRAWSQASQPILGYAWSDTIGWIDLNCQNQNTCASVSFGITSASNGTLSGYAWSDNVGWVSANAGDLFGCPEPPCNARVQGGQLRGWLKALAANDTQSGGWDGFISLDGPGYGVTADSGGSTYSGYAWGSTVIGWLTLSIPLLPAECQPIYSCVGNAVHNSCTNQDTACPSGYFCSGGACFPPVPPSGTISVRPSLVAQRGTVQVIWSASHVSS